MTTAFYSTCIFLCAIFSETKAQPALQRFFTAADTLMQQSRFSDAALAYERCVFACHDTNPEWQNRALLKKAMAYKAQGNFAQTLQTLYRINFYQLTDSARLATGYEIVLNAYLTGQFTDAESQLQQLAYFIPDSATFNQQLLFLKILVLNELQKWPEAKTAFTQYLILNRHPPELANIYYDFMRRPRLKNPQKARRLSTFMPGVGQLYGGNVGAGLLNLGLQLGLLSFGVYEIWQGYYLTGFGTGLALTQAFYFGGIENAETVTKRKNKEKIARYNNRIKQFILTVEQSK